jgi:hypothetical protein
MLKTRIWKKSRNWKSMISKKWELNHLYNDPKISAIEKISKILYKSLEYHRKKKSKMANWVIEKMALCCLFKNLTQMIVWCPYKIVYISWCYRTSCIFFRTCTPSKHLTVPRQTYKQKIAKSNILQPGVSWKKNTYYLSGLILSHHLQNLHCGKQYACVSVTKPGFKIKIS